MNAPDQPTDAEQREMEHLTAEADAAAEAEFAADTEGQR